ncbi:1531_t:CDS:2, partial [Gigaspora rosea]
DPLKHLPDDNQVHLFLSSLKENIAIFTAMHNLTFLEDAINTAEEVAAIVRIRRLNELKPIVIDLKEGTKIIIAEDVITRIEKEVPIEFNEDNITIQPILKKHITKHQPSIQKLAIILRRPMAPVESNLVEAVMTIAAKCYIWIKDNSIRFGVA